MKNFETADTDMTFYDFGVIQTEIDRGRRHGGYVQLERAVGKNEKLGSFKLENRAKLERTESWNVSPEVRKFRRSWKVLAEVGKFKCTWISQIVHFQSFGSSSTGE